MTTKKLLYIGNKLSKHGNTTTVIETLGLSLSIEGYQVVYASDKKNQIVRLLDMIVVTLFNLSKVDYVIIDTYSTFSFNYALIISQICRLFHKKYIPILHGGNLPNRLENSKFLSQLVFKNAYTNVAPSQYLRTAFATKGYDNVIFIPNTIEINNYQFLEREFIEPKLLWVRSLAKLYNPKMAIQVTSKLQSVFPNVQLCMVGPDKENLLQECQQFAQKLKVNVVFTGKLSKEDWVELSKKYNVFINTTHFDNTPVSVIEAMALGLPIVSTNVGGIPFLIKDKQEALLISDNDSEEMYCAVKELFENTDLRKTIVLNARKKAETFDWEHVKQKWVEILK